MTPGRLLLTAFWLFVGVVVLDANVPFLDRLDEHPLIDGLFGTVAVLIILLPVVALIWWPFHLRARREREREHFARIVDEQSAIDWHVTAIDELDGLPVVTVHRADTGEQRHVIAQRDDNHGTVPTLGTRVVLTHLPTSIGTFVELHDRKAWTEVDVEVDVEEFRGRDLTGSEARVFEDSAPQWPTS